MAHQAGPARIVTIDVNLPLPDLNADDRYKNVWVVLCRDGVPRHLTMMDLTIGASAIKSHLQEIVDRPEVSGPLDSQPEALPDNQLPRISLIVPTIVARVEELGNCLDSIVELDYPDFEVLLVDNRRVLPSPDPLPDVVEGRPWLRVIREARPGVSAARNAGIAQATGELVAFTDDDVQVDRQWLRSIGTRMALNPAIGAVTGLILPAELESPAQIWFERYYGGFGSERTFAPVTLEAAPSKLRFLRGSRVLVRNAMGIELRRFSIYGVGAYGAGANMAFRKSVLDRIGGFDVTLGVGMPAHGGEDLAVFIGVLWSGSQIGYEPAAFVHHRHRQSYTELLQQIDGYGQGFTAMLIALIRLDRRHLFSILYQLPLALKWKAVQGVDRVRGKQTSGSTGQVAVSRYPSALFKREIWGFLRGPLAYARSQKFWRKVSSAPPTS